MSTTSAQPRYDSALDMYQSMYSHAIREVRPAGRTGGVMLSCEQSAGDWSDAATPDLVLTQVVSKPVMATMDAGAGRFRHLNAPGRFFVVPPGTATQIVVDGPHAIRFLAVPYQALRQLAGADAGLPADGDFGALHAGLHADAALATLLERLWHEGRAGSPHGALFADGLMLEMAALMLRARDGKPQPVAQGRLANHQLQRLVRYLDDHLAQNTSLAELAALVDLSPAHLCRAFKQSTGLPPHQWRLARRVERARELLERTDLPMTAIAAAVGYEDPGQFAVAFRRLAGATPSQYRKERRT